MATVNDYAALSADVYNSSGAPNGWARLDPPSGFTAADPNFYAAAYQNIATGEIVVAFRGTDGAGDAVSDAQLYAGQQPAQYNEAAAFYGAVVGQYGNATLTGHSLGGALASMVAANEAANGNPVDATAFNAVPVKNSLYDIGLDPNGDYSNITNYNAVFDPASSVPFINQIGNISTVFVSSFALIPDWLEPLVASLHPLLAAYFQLDQHSIANLVNANFVGAENFIRRRDPLTFDLDGDGIETVGIDPNNPILFDHDGDGLKTATGWVASDDAFLVLDRDGNGAIDSGRELFGDSTPLLAGGNAADGFAALQDQDTNADGIVDSNDTSFANLRLWQDLNQNGISEANELFTLANAGIAAIHVGKVENNTVLPNGNVLADLGHYTKTDGSEGALGAATGQLGDVDLREDTFHSQFTDANPLTPEAAVLPDMHGSGQVRDLQEAASLSPDFANLLTTYAHSITRAEQLAQLDTLLKGWSNTSAMPTTATGAYGTRPLTIVFEGVAEGSPAYAAWLEKLSVLERFNGRTFRPIPADPTAPVRVELLREQQQLLDRAYATLRESVYESLFLQTRGKEYLDAIGLTVDENGNVVLDFAGMQALLDEALRTDPARAFGDVLDLYVNGSDLKTSGWDGVSYLVHAQDVLAETDAGRAVLADPSLAGPDFQGLRLGHAADDLLTGDGKENLVIGGAGDDISNGGIGDDVLFGFAGNDALVGDPADNIWTGNDTLYGGDGDDYLDGGNYGDDSLYGGAGNDILYDVGNNNFLDGGDGNDSLYGGSGASTLIGGAGDDTLSMALYAGASVFRGGTGRDVLTGSGAGDTYYYDLGDGADTIRDQSAKEGEDVVVFGPGIAPADFNAQRLDNDLVLIHQNGTDRLTFRDWYDSTGFRNLIERFEFADGTVWTASDATGRAVTLGSMGDDRITGINYNDTLFGLAGNDTLVGDIPGSNAGGNDILDGGDGDDYLDGGNYGDDTLLGGAGNDILYDVGNNNFLDGGDGNDSLYSGGGGASTLIGGAGDDTLRAATGYGGSGFRFVFRGGTGHDVITGAAAGDTYYYDLGDGADEIRDYSLAGGDDIVVFGTGLHPGDFTFERLNNDLVLSHANGTDAITVRDWYLSDNGVFRNHIERFEFADGTVWTAADATARTITRGSAADDRIIGTNYDDRIFGLAGNDTLVGDIPGSNTGGNDTLDGGDGNDYLDGGDYGDDSLYGGAGNDILYDISNNNWLDGDDGNDTLYGGNGHSTLIGGAGDDTLSMAPYAGASVFRGGTGRDVLTGTGAGDTYYYDLGDGDDTIRDQSNSGAQDVIVFGPGITPTDFTATRIGNNDLILTHLNGTDRITIQDWYVSDFGYRHRIERFDFADGTTLGIVAFLDIKGVDHVGTAGPDVFAGGDNIDRLYGGDGADTLNGGLNHDVLLGGAGDDTLNGDNDNDTLDGGAGNDTLDGGGNEDILLGGAGDDVLNGLHGSDSLTGGAGADLLVGGEHRDTYYYGRGDGADTIVEYGSVNLDDRLVLGPGIAPADFRLTHVGNDLLADLGGGDTLTFRDWYRGNDRQVDYFSFADGTMVTASGILAGTAGDDVLAGTSAVDFLFGGDGNDILTGNAGNDILGGGAGADALIGGVGNDVYYYNPGNASDTVLDAAGMDTLRFETGITSDNLMTDASGNDLLIHVENDTLTIQNWFLGPDYRIENIRFADGSSYDATWLESLSRHAPELSAPTSDQSVDEDSPFTLDLSGAFFDEDLSRGDFLTYSAALTDGSGLPGWLGFDTDTGRLSGTADNTAVGSYDITVTATDTDGQSVSDTLTLTVSNVNDAPIVVNCVADQAIDEDSLFSLSLMDVFADDDLIHGDSITLSAMRVDGGGWPDWLVFDAATSTFAGIPDNWDVGSYEIRVTATDVAGTSAGDMFVVTVNNTNDIPIVANSIIDQATDEDSPFSFTLADAFTDDDLIYGDTLTLSAVLADGSILPDWLTFDAATGTFTGTPDNWDVGSYNLRVTATDIADTSASDVFTLTVNNTNDAPVLANSIADETTTEGIAFIYSLPGNIFHDDDAIHGDVLSYAATLTDGGALPTWLTFDAATQALTGTASADSALVGTNGDDVLIDTDTGISGTWDIKITATDTSGVSADDSFTLTLQGVAGNDTLNGGKGNDVLNGGGGNDTYIYSQGDGLDTLTDREGQDTVAFGEGYSFANTVIRTEGNIAHLRFLDNDGCETGEGMDSTNGTAIESFTFADGSAHTLADLLVTAQTWHSDKKANTIITGRNDDTVYAGKGGDTVYTSSGNDTLYGEKGNDKLYGEGGNDSLYGGKGDDLLNGGCGNDLLDGGQGHNTLIGGKGNDTLILGDDGENRILFNAGDGWDTLKTATKDEGHDNDIHFGAGITQNNLWFSRNGSDLIIDVLGTHDGMTIQGWYDAKHKPIEEIKTSNGYELEDKQIELLIQAMAAFGPIPGSGALLPTEMPDQLQATLAAAWETGHG